MLSFYGPDKAETSASGIAPEVVDSIAAGAKAALNPRCLPIIEKGGAEVLCTSSTAIFLLYTILPEQ